MILSDQQKALLNYFSPTQPVSTPKSLKGREQELQEALRYLLNEEGVIVQGARRIGKTSFLHCLGDLCLKQNRRFVYLSFQSLAQYGSKSFWEHLHRQLCSQTEFSDYQAETESGIFNYFKQLGQFVENKLGPKENLIFFIDEFQLTEKFSERDRHILYNQLRDIIEERAIHAQLRRFVFVLATSQSLSDLSVGVSSTLASAFPKTFRLGRLSSQSCHELIKEALTDIIEIAADTVDLLAQKSGGHPYLLKLLLHDLIINHPAEFFTGQTATLAKEMVQRQITELSEDLAQPHFEMLKNTLNEAEMQILYEIDKHQKLGFLDIREATLPYFERLASSGSIASARPTLDHLQNLQILRKDNELFCFSNDIYQRWFAQFFEQYYLNEALREFRKRTAEADAAEIKPISSTQEFMSCVDGALLKLKIVFEEKGLWELIWKDKSRGIVHHERYLQKLTAALLDSYLANHNIMVEREVESGTGPVDIKLSVDRELTACLEIKKFPGDIYHGLEVELNAYMGSTIKLGFWVVFYTGATTKLTSIMKELQDRVQKLAYQQSDKQLKTICINCTPRPSASKRIKPVRNKLKTRSQKRN